MAGVVDADTHIIEHPGMWELFDPELYPRRPVLASTTDNSVYGHNNQVWLIDGVAVPKRFGKGSAIVAVGGSDAEEARTDIAKAVRYITDATARVRDMDMRGVDAEVVFPTLLLGYLPVEVDLEVAICAAYNRYLARASGNGAAIACAGLSSHRCGTCRHRCARSESRATTVRWACSFAA